MINNPIIYKFFTDLTNHRKKSNRMVDLSTSFLNTGNTVQTFHQSGKKDSFRHILKSSGSMYESSVSQFFRTTTGMQSGPDAFEESRFTMTFLGQVENSEISKSSESSEFCFRLFHLRLFDFDLISKIENSKEENSEKKFRAFRGFRAFDLPHFRIFNPVSQI